MTTTRPATLALLAGAAALSSCVTTTQLASTQTTVDASARRATVVVMRPNPLGVAVRNEVYDGTNLIGYTAPRGYVSWEVPPGERQVGTGGENLDFVTFVAEPGETYYFKQGQRLGVITPRVKLVALDQERGAKMLARMTAPELIEGFASRADSNGG